MTCSIPCLAISLAPGETAHGPSGHDPATIRLDRRATRPSKILGWPNVTHLPDAIVIDGLHPRPRINGTMGVQTAAE
jgi:hypothetical protein